MSDFALRQLKKFGWTEGEGLGKTKSGISKPVKASMKFSRRGLGAAYKPSEKDEFFWSAVYEEAIKKVAVNESASTGKKSSSVSILPKLKFEAAKELILKSVGEKTEETNPRDGGQDTNQESTDTIREASPKSPFLKAIKRKATKIAFEHHGTLLDPVFSKTVESSPTFANLRRSSSSSHSYSGPESQIDVKSRPKKSRKKGHAESSETLVRGTGHPAARFGIRCSGKLARVAKFL